MNPYALEASSDHVALIRLPLLHAIDANLLQEIIAVDDNEEIVIPLIPGAMKGELVVSDTQYRERT